MAVYVDDMKAAYGRMVMCHMLADSSAELMAMADRIGVARKWIQKAGTYHEHFDIALSKRALAVAAGALEIDRQGVAAILKRKRLEIAARVPVTEG
ncbi:DUF4031 domain-containing protein [Caballeronia sp. AZ7_KS35]|uniref:DUF4031 domain-containing protein n=1 Tax=Caballeronia sp. AZ7_KS35 TaxID=2921762 RepID=UPI00202857D8|nr:DUF4031 domain-containing protein [Caballeronia sp. AZ7_KS35]